MSAFADIVQGEAPAKPVPAPKSRDGNEFVTPNGTRITFHEKPHRHYKINGERVASVTQVLDVIDRPALKWWGMKVGVAGVLELVREHNLRPEFSSVEEIVGTTGAPGLLTQHKLTVNHVREQAAARGTRVHDALEVWSHNRVRPNPLDYPEEERGYIRGLLTFIDEISPEPDGIEVMVGSVTHEFAGRCDLLRALVREPRIGTVAIDKEGNALRGIIPAGRYLLDLKTSASIYDEAMLQVEGYEGASVECGWEPTDFRAVVRVSEDGRYEFVRSEATYDDFLAARQLFDAMRRLKERRARVGRDGKGGRRDS